MLHIWCDFCISFFSLNFFMEKQGSKMIKKILPAICLLVLSHTASASIIETTFNWSAECSDCSSVKGDESFDFSHLVTGNVVLAGYTEGEAFTFDQSNLVSFQYDGPSNHVDNLVVHNANFDLDDQWVDESDWVSSFFGGDIFTVPGVTLNPDSVIDGYTHFGENMIASGWLAADLSSYFLNLSFDTFVPIDDISGEYIPFSALTGDFNTFAKKTFNIFYQSNGDWSVNVDDVPADLGRGARIALPATQVPESSSIAILSLSLLGLVRFRMKKS